MSIEQNRESAQIHIGPMGSGKSTQIAEILAEMVEPTTPVSGSA